MTCESVKQELAKEGVIPGHRFFRAEIRTPWSNLPPWFGGYDKTNDPEEHGPETTPAPALLLHFAFAMILIGATSPTSTTSAYKLLVALYSYGIIIMVGFFVAFGLLWLRFRSSRSYFTLFGHFFSEDHGLRNQKEWHSDSGIKPWITLTAAIIYAVVTGFLFVVTWIPPNNASPFKYDVPWYVVPVTCVGIVLVGTVYYYIFTGPYAKCVKGDRIFIAERDPKIMFDGEYVQTYEVIEAKWWAAQHQQNSNFPGYVYGENGIPMHDLPDGNRKSSDGSEEV